MEATKNLTLYQNQLHNVFLKQTMCSKPKILNKFGHQCGKSKKVTSKWALKAENGREQAFQFV